MEPEIQSHVAGGSMKLKQRVLIGSSHLKRSGRVENRARDQLGPMQMKPLYGQITRSRELPADALDKKQHRDRLRCTEAVFVS